MSHWFPLSHKWEIIVVHFSISIKCNLFSEYEVTWKIPFYRTETAEGIILPVIPPSAEKAMVTHSSTLAWKIPWMEEPGGLQSMGLWRIRHDWATSLSLFTFVHLEKEMATHSSVLAWRIPETAELGGLPSMGPHRVGHHWSDLAAAAATMYRTLVTPALYLMYFYSRVAILILDSCNNYIFLSQNAMYPLVFCTWILNRFWKKKSWRSNIYSL